MLVVEKCVRIQTDLTYQNHQPRSTIAYPPRSHRLTALTERARNAEPKFCWLHIELAAQHNAHQYRSF